MEKIVIITNRSVPDDNLIACLQVLFPDCDIRVISVPVGSFGDFSVAENCHIPEGGKKNGQTPDFG